VPARFSLSIVVMLLACASATAANPTAVALAASANPALLGTTVRLTATISPSSATGSVTFYDGVARLGTSAVSSGQASFSTRLLPCCVQSLTARYSGDSINAASVSSKLAQNIVVPAQSGVGAPANYSTGANPQSIAVGDFNGDGIPDLVVANAGELTVSVFLGMGNGLFQPGQLFSSGSDPYAVAVADLNGDGIADLVVANSADSTVSVLLGVGNGTFQNPVAYPTGADPVSIVAADFNGDGIVDIATANFYDGDVTILLGNGNGTLGPAQNFGVGSGPVALVAGDFNNDGRADLAIANSNDNTVAILIGNGNGTFAPAAAVAGGLGPFGIVAGDFNNDGVTDLAVADFGAFSNQQGGGVAVLLGTGNGTFRPVVISSGGPAPQGLAAGDFNGDGTLDLVVANQTGVSILIGNGDGSFQAPLPVAAGTSTLAIALADFNGDSFTDLAVSNFNSNNVAVLPGTAGTCTYALSTPAPTTVPFLWDAKGGTFTLDVSSNSPGCTWTATANSWISPGSLSSLGGGPVSITVRPNTTGAARSGTFQIGNQSFSIAQAVTPKTFTDVALGTYYFDAVNLLKAKNITDGCGLTIFCPTEVIDRAQMAIFLTRAVYGGDKFTSSLTPYFKDVPASAFGFKWIQKLYELGITTGCGIGTYCPNQPVSRDQMAVFIIRTRFGAKASFDWPPTPLFTDVPADSWTFPSIQRLKMDSITSGCGVTLYCPASPVSRADMAVFLMRGLFDVLLPPGTPILSQISPSAIPNGQTTVVTITGANTSFNSSHTLINPIAGVQIGPITVASPTSLTVSLTAAPGQSAEPLSVVVVTGLEEAVLPNALSIQ
jgi:hypothetical protein